MWQSFSHSCHIMCILYTYTIEPNHQYPISYRILLKYNSNLFIYSNSNLCTMSFVIYIDIFIYKLSFSDEYIMYLSIYIFMLYYIFIYILLSIIEYVYHTRMIIYNSKRWKNTGKLNENLILIWSCGLFDKF